MPIWMKRIGKRRFSRFSIKLQGVWDCFRQTPAPCMPGGRKLLNRSVEMKTFLKCFQDKPSTTVILLVARKPLSNQKS